MKVITVAMAIALLAVIGCKDEQTGPDGATAAKESNAAVERLKDKKGGGDAGTEGSKPKQPKIEDVAGFVYERSEGRDPFRSFEWERPDRMSAFQRTPLEQFDVNQLSVVGVVWKTGSARALVTDPAGQSYIVAEGTRIGKNEGRIIDIDDNLVIVRETYVDYMGQRTTKDVEMRVRRSEGG